MASNDWKKKNYNTGIKVSQSTINELKANKSFSANVAKFKASGASAEQREAMNRFYGKSRVDSALGSSVSPINKTYPSASSGYKGVSSTNYKAPKGSKVAGPSNASKVGGFIKNELLGVDDFSRAVKYAKKGNVVGALKSAATGSFELGTTGAAVVGSAFTGGATGAALVSGKAAQVAARQAGKQVLNRSVKAAAATGSKKAVAKAVVKKSVGLATGTSAVRAGGRAGAKLAGKGYGVVAKQAAKRDIGGVRTKAIAEATAKHATSMSSKANAALSSQKAATVAKSVAERAVPAVKSGARKGMPKTTGKEATALKNAAIKQAAAKQAASKASAVSKNAYARAAAAEAKVKARKAAMKKSTSKARAVAGTALVSKTSGKAMDVQIKRHDKKRKAGK